MTSSAAAVIAGFGLCACCVGFLFSFVSQLSVQAGAAALIDRAEQQPAPA